MDVQNEQTAAISGIRAGAGKSDQNNKQGELVGEAAISGMNERLIWEQPLKRRAEAIIHQSRHNEAASAANFPLSAAIQGTLKTRPAEMDLPVFAPSLKMLSDGLEPTTLSFRATCSA